MIGEDAIGGAGLCVVGNPNRDVEVSGIRAAARLLEDGETSAGQTRETVGGGGAHSAAAAARLGASAPDVICGVSPPAPDFA